MYEQETNDVILRRMLARVSSSLDKREGSILYDATAPASIEMELLYAVVDYFLKNTFGDTAERPFLVERAKERGLSPYQATYAYVRVHVEPETAAIEEGNRFSYDDVNYVIVGPLENGDWRARCETAGTVGNKPAAQLIPIQYVRGLTRAEVVEVIQPGEDEEDTETFRDRYLASFNTQAYGGNIADYKAKVNAIPGVGGVKVYPVWNGGGTVKVVIMTSEAKPASTELVAEVQEILDPIPYQQQGVGLAPIGHRVMVESAQAETVDIGLRITFSEGSTWKQYAEDIQETIAAYFEELNKTWETTQTVAAAKFENVGLIVRISQIETRLLQKPYVTDISHTTLSGSEENRQLTAEGLAAVGTISDLSGGTS